MLVLRLTRSVMFLRDLLIGSGFLRLLREGNFIGSYGRVTRKRYPDQ